MPIMVRVNKRAQLKIQQMAFMLIAVTMFFALVGLFVLGITSGELKRTATSLEQEKASMLASKIANSPEFSCESAFNYGESNCIDSDKVMILKDKKAYQGFWGIADIQIIKIYPEQGKETECTQENYPDCNLIKVYSEDVKKSPYQYNFVSLCRKELSENKETYDKCEIAKILISSQDKT
jgi:hypothetical protein